MLAACNNSDSTDGKIGKNEQEFLEGYALKAAVLYAEGETWKDTFYWLEQSPSLGLQVEAVQVDEQLHLSEYDVVYLDESILDIKDDSLAESIMSYTYDGGAVFAPNNFYDYFPQEYFGASDVKKIESFCDGLEFPDCKGDLNELQQVVEDFSSLYDDYLDFEVLSAQDYGWGLEADTAIPIVKWGELTLYALNEYGEGRVFFVNPLLPNRYSIGQLTMNSDDAVSTFASTTASFNQLLLSEYANYVAKEKHGYALERVYGYYGTPSMSWELHYEEITGIANDSLQIFSELCEQYRQIPSFTLIRNSYAWYLRAESVTYLLNNSDTGYDYQMDYNESAYSSGTHVDSDGQWLTLVNHTGAGGYFEEYPEFLYRAYPVALDYDSDGETDLICGSEDGYIYYYSGIAFEEGRLKVGAAQKITDKSGQPICYGAYSAPQMMDVDQDGLLDLICGYEDGMVYWFRGNGTISFEARGILFDCDLSGQAFPGVGDVNNDAIPDLLLGSNSSTLLLYTGRLDKDGNVCYSRSEMQSLSRACEDAKLGTWLAPSFVDWNEDGIQDVAVGTFDGYIAILLGTDAGKYVFDSYITADEKNYKGNNNLKFGNCSVPTFIDLDGDKAEDLLCGSQEYGIAYPIDSEYFVYADKLAEQMKYAKDHDYYMGIHFYTNAYASKERELTELELHKKAFEKYGLSTEKIGVNQHTWYTSSFSGAQTMSDIYEAGLLWTSGFNPPGEKTNHPEKSAEAVVALPFYLVEDGEWTTLVQNHSVISYADDERQEISARYRMPVCVYHHCDFIYLDEATSLATIQATAAFNEKYHYNFNREDQMMFASAAALHQNVEVGGGLFKEGGLQIENVVEKRDYALYDENVSNSLGVRIELAAGYDASDFKIDADVWYLDGNAIVIGLNRKVNISKGNEKDDSHIAKVNMAAQIETTEDGATVSFLSGGMMQAIVQGEATTDSSGWEVVKKDGWTIFTKYGTEESLNLNF